VERRWIGGSCPNVACLPSKNEIRSAEVAHLARVAAQFGTMTSPVKVDMAKVRQRKRDMVPALVDAHLRNYQTSGAELIMGSGCFVAPKTIEVTLNDGGTRTLAGAQVFLNVRTHGRAAMRRYDAKQLATYSCGSKAESRVPEAVQDSADECDFVFWYLMERPHTGRVLSPRPQS
jgi:pyruvate/2-oxoglutarate dehydrogenase complex dihydrolipoamide dehydrogenase (E3) component